MDIKYAIKIEYMKCVLQINGFSGPRPRVRSNRRVESGRVGLGEGGATFILILVQWFRKFYEFTLNYV